MRIPLFGSSIGAAWLSTQTEETIRASVKLSRRELGKKANDVDAILEQVRRVAQRGYACGGISENGRFSGVTVPLPASPDGIVLVIGTAGPSDEIDARREELAASIKDTVRQHMRRG
jgi:DNA-binding IclR family transcriptional regulator